MRLAYNQIDAAAQLDMGVKMFRRHVAPDLKKVYVGDLVRYPHAELQRWLERRSV